MENEFMLCNKVKKLTDVNLKEYIGEWKLDGERIRAVKIGNDISLWNRRGREKSSIYVEVIEGLKELDFNFIVDSEVITETGLFNDLQHRSNCKPTEKRLKDYPIKIMIFDITFFNEEDLRNKTLLERKKYLEHFRDLKNVEVLNWYEDSATIKTLWNWVRLNNKEGILLKKKNSVYESKRSNDWLKLKNWKEITIDFGYYEENNSGIKLSTENNFYEVQVQDNNTDRINKIKNEIDKGNKVKIEVQYLEKTSLGKLRFPSFKEIIENGL